MPQHLDGRTHTSDVPGHSASPVGGRRLRLARTLAEMLPGARTLRVTLRGPAQAWPSPHASASDGAGRRMPLSCPQARTAALWIIRACPEADWSQDRECDLKTGRLLCPVGPRPIASGGR